MDCMTNKRLRLVYGDGTLGVHGEGFDYLFSYGRGGMESLAVCGMEWLYRTPAPTFWRALTDNDRGSRFHLKSGMWLAADMFTGCADIKVRVDGAEIPLPIAPENNRYNGTETAETVCIVFVYRTITVPATQVEVSYEVSGDGRIRVDVYYHGNRALPELPVFGMRFILPTKASSYRYEGLSGETYPDRMAGGIPGVYEVEGLPVTPYLVPQDCNVHMGTKWLEVARDTTLSNVKYGVRRESVSMDGHVDGQGEKGGRKVLRFTAIENNFAFSCIPYTAQELENATHQEELPPARRTVVSILGAVRGVGGINSWGADVEPACHIDAGEDIRYSFGIEW